MKLTPRDRVLLGVIAALVLCVGFYKLILTPERHHAAHLQAQIATAEASLAKAQQEDLEGRAAEVALRRQQPYWTAARRAIPQQADIPALLKLLARGAREAHVTMQSISLTNAGTSSSVPPPGPAGTVSIPVSLTFSGGYQALNRLVARLDSLVVVSRRDLRASGPLVGIGAVNVTPLASPTHPSALNVQLTATIYQHAGAAAAAGASTGATG